MQSKNLKRIIFNIIGISIFENHDTVSIIKRRNRRVLLFIYTIPIYLLIVGVNKFQHTDVLQNEDGYMIHQNNKTYYFLYDKKYEILLDEFGELIDLKFITPID